MLNQNVILITGKPGIGKTTLVRKIIEGIPNCGGFYTREVRVDGKRTGFEIIILDGRIGTLATSSPEPEFRSKAMVGRFRVNVEVVDTIVIDALQKAVEENRVVIIDEIGPMELFSERFQQAVLDILNHDELKVIGTIVDRSFELTDQIKQHPRVKLVRLDEQNRDTMFEELADMLNILL